MISSIGPLVTVWQVKARGALQRSHEGLHRESGNSSKIVNIHALQLDDYLAYHGMVVTTLSEGTMG